MPNHITDINSIESVRAASNYHVDLEKTVQSIDGYLLQDNDRILLLCQNDPVDNGIYIYSEDTHCLERSYEFPSNSLMPLGTFTFVERGFTYSDMSFISSRRSVIDQDPVLFNLFNNPTKGFSDTVDSSVFLQNPEEVVDKWKDTMNLFSSLLQDSGYTVLESKLDFNSFKPIISENHVIFHIKCTSFVLLFTIESFSISSDYALRSTNPKFSYLVKKGSITSEDYQDLLSNFTNPRFYESVVNWLSILNV